MALADIEKRIISDAEKEAAQIISRARAEQDARLRDTEKALRAQRSVLTERLAERSVREVKQYEQLQNMEAVQKLLRVKREQMKTVIMDVRDEILADQGHMAAYFQNVLKQSLPVSGVLHLEVSAKDEKSLKSALKELESKAEVVVQKDRPVGTLEIVLDRARIDCSLDLYIEEQSRRFEAQLASILFDGEQ